MTKNVTESPKKDKDRLALQKEVLEALFTVPERCEEVPKRILPVRRSRAFGKPVVETFTDTAIMHKIATVQPIEVTRDGMKFDFYFALWGNNLFPRLFYRGH